MTIDQVIQAGDIHLSFWYAFFHMGWWKFIIAFVVCALFFLFASIETNGADRCFQFILIPLFFIMVLTMITSTVKDSRESELVQKWKTEVVYPYIQSLPTKKGEAVFLKIEPQIQYNISYKIWAGRYIDSTKLTPLTVTFKTDNHTAKTITNWYSAEFILTPDKTSYVEYRLLDKDLGHDINAGIYYPSVYLPEDYHFTDIK